MNTSIAPWLSLRNSNAAVAFYKSAFGAEEVFRLEAPDGALVARLSIQGAEFWLSEESPENGNFSPETLGGGTVRMITDGEVIRIQCFQRPSKQAQKKYPQ